MNSKIVTDTSKLEFYIRPLSDEAAFNKGVEYFVEILFFYGVLAILALFEIKRAYRASERQKNNLKNLSTQCESY